MAELGDDELGILPPEVRVDVELPAVPDEEDYGALQRDWWRQNKPEDVLRSTTLLGAMNDVGVLSLAHLMKRLASPKTPVKEKTTIALTMGPRLAVGLRQHLRRPTREDRDEPLDITPARSRAQGLLDVYDRR